MSCTSPFVYAANAEYEESTYSITTVGPPYTIKGYTIPSEEMCLYGWNPGHCNWGGWQNMDCNGWVSGSGYWYDCWATPAIPVWPTLTITATSTMNMSADLIGGSSSISVTGPSYPYVAQQIVINSVYVQLTINETPVHMLFNTPPFPITMTASSASGFSTTVALASISTVYEGIGIDISASLLFCMDPTPPQSWCNIDLSFALTYETYNTQFSIACPITDVE
jgi:hypothetical protein